MVGLVPHSPSTSTSTSSSPRQFQQSLVTIPTLFGGSFTLPLWQSNEPPKLSHLPKPSYTSYQSITSKALQRSPSSQQKKPPPSSQSTSSASSSSSIPSTFSSSQPPPPPPLPFQ
ncbi:hypothetical protein HMI54_004848 [Coelomomyces lativittatus]|nr:hypothetical protein HMI56_006307 [Coelomomyces lativittatus]KAJ1518762.1 hypothetical protein HMI54_004848 [Coelomomyces lativittatus]